MDAFQYSEVTKNSAPPREHHGEKEVPVVSPRRLRDRDLLKRKREEAKEKDAYYEQTKSKRQRQTKGTSRGRRMQVKTPEPEPQPEPKNEPDYEGQQDAEPQHEAEHVPEYEAKHVAEPEQEPEPKSEIGHNIQQEIQQHEQQPFQHYEVPVITVSEGESADVIFEHEEEEKHIQDNTSLLTEEEKVVDVLPETITGAPEVLSFPLHPEQEEHQYYTPLL